MADAIIHSVNDTSYLQMQFDSYVGKGPTLKDTYTLSNVLVKTFDREPKYIQIYGITGNGNIKDGESGFLEQGQKIYGGPNNNGSNAKTPVLHLDGKNLYAMSWTYTANGGFYFYANNSGTTYRILVYY